MIRVQRKLSKDVMYKRKFSYLFTIIKFPTDRVCEKSTRTNIKKKIYLMENSTVKIKLRKCKEKIKSYGTKKH